MIPSVYIEFFRAQGHRVIETESCCWYDYRPFALKSVPYHRPLCFLSSEINRALLRTFSAALRFPAVRAPGGKQTNILVCRKRDYSLSSLHHKARNQTRRGLEQCTVEQLDFEYLARCGHELNIETFVRQRRDLHPVLEKRWRSCCRYAKECPDFEAWGAFVNGQLAAFLIAGLLEDCLYIEHQSSATKLLSFFQNNALTFVVTKTKLALPKISSVYYGVASLTRKSLDQFKTRMGFEEECIGDGFALNPLLRPMFAFGGRRVMRWMAKRYPESDSWQSASVFLGQFE